MLRLWIALAMSLASSVTFAENNNLCTLFDPATNKYFYDGYGLNQMTVTRANTKLSGSITHKYDSGKNKGQVKTATFSGICTGNQFSISWQGSYRGQLSGVLTCANNTYNLVNVIAVIDGYSSFINVMASAPNATACPNDVA